MRPSEVDDTLEYTILVVSELVSATIVTSMREVAVCGDGDEGYCTDEVEKWREEAVGSGPIS